MPGSSNKSKAVAVARRVRAVIRKAVKVECGETRYNKLVKNKNFTNRG